jgi:hypothetical protein
MAVSGEGAGKILVIGRSPERRAANESTFGEANEGIEASVEELGLTASLVPFLCECEEERCMAIVRLALPEYERVRRMPKRFLVAPGHESAPDRVIAERERFTSWRRRAKKGASSRGRPAVVTARSSRAMARSKRRSAPRAAPAPSSTKSGIESVASIR